MKDFERKELIRMLFGSKLKAIREERGLTRAGIEEALNLIRGTVSNWENGYREPEEELLPELASLLGIELTKPELKAA